MAGGWCCPSSTQPHTLCKRQSAENNTAFGSCTQQTASWFKELFFFKDTHLTHSFLKKCKYQMMILIMKWIMCLFVQCSLKFFIMPLRLKTNNSDFDRNHSILRLFETQQRASRKGMLGVPQRTLSDPEGKQLEIQPWGLRTSKHWCIAAHPAGWQH